MESCQMACQIGGQMWSQALRLIQTRAAGLVAALENMTMAQLNFRSGIAIKSKD